MKCVQVVGHLPQFFLTCSCGPAFDNGKDKFKFKVKNMELPVHGNASRSRQELKANQPNKHAT